MDRILKNGVDHLDMRENHAPRSIDWWDAQILRAVDPERPKPSKDIGAVAFADEKMTPRARSSHTAHRMERFEAYGFARAANMDRPIV